MNGSEIVQIGFKLFGADLLDRFRGEMHHRQPIQYLCHPRWRREVLGENITPMSKLITRREQVERLNRPSVHAAGR